MATQNRFEGHCCECKTKVEQYSGFITPKVPKGYKVWCPSCYEKQYGEKPNIKPQDFSRSSHRGQSLGLSVKDSWLHIFVKNEEMYDSETNPLTDLQISEFMLKEFPKSSRESKSTTRVRMYRNSYNRGAHSFKGDGIPEVQSHEYGEDGEPVSARTRSSSGISEQRIREIVRAEFASRPVIELNFFDETKIRIDASTKHASFTDAMQKLSAGLNVFLTGPT